MADTNSSLPIGHLTMLSPTRSWLGDWDAFRSNYPDWLPARDTNNPLYCLPAAAVASLARPRGSSPGLLAPRDVQAERAFTALCNAHHAVGCSRDQVILSSILTPPPLPDANLMKKAGWSSADQLRAREALRAAEDASLRLKGYAGWLLTEPPFLTEVRQLTECWQQLPGEQRPLFPLGRMSLPAASLLPTATSPEAAAFMDSLRAFLDRWALTQLSTWDLPQPQGPLLPNPLPPGSPALPAHGVHLVLPLHYPLQGDDELLRKIVEFQRQFAREQGLDESLAGLSHYRLYANLFDVLHLERTIRSRCAAVRPPRGLVSRIEGAIADALGVSHDQIRKLRKAISACQRGRRARVAWLRPRTR